MMRKKICLTLSVLFACWLGSAGAQSVVVDGVGADEAAAQRDAVRNAVEQAAGTYLSSRTLVADGQTQLDEIYAQSQGYVTHTETLSRAQEAGGVRLRVRVEVDMSADSKLMSRLQTVAFLDDPRIASPGAAMPRLPIGASVVVVELGFAGENDADQMIGLTRRKMASRAVEDINLRIMQQAGQRLALKDLPDDSSFYEHAEDERALAGGVKESEAMHIGKAVGADYVVYGSLIGAGINDSSVESLLYNAQTRTATVTLTLRVIDCRSGAIVAMATGEGASKLPVACSSDVLQVANMVMMARSGGTGSGLGSLGDKTISSAAQEEAVDLLSDTVGKAANAAAKNLLTQLGY